ncbi:MAG: hypothetical protein RBR50_01025 [Candidatus Izemoplasmatales bacterium]|nr:hypothetical protein [Candidatus Izemoplasmatales bacterium]
MRISNIIGLNGKAIANQYILTHDNGDKYFQSYDSIIAVKKANGDILLDEKSWNFSSTTAKYRNVFLNETTKGTQKKIDAGIYKLANLNSEA